MALKKVMQIFSFAIQNVNVSAASAAADCKYILNSVTIVSDEYVRNPLMHDTWHCQKRFMKSRRVRDRSKKKKEAAFEKVMKRQGPLSRVLMLMEILKCEPEQVMTLNNLAFYRRRLNITSSDRIPLFLRRYPKIFELYTDRRGATWCGFTAEAESLLEEERRLKKEYESTAVNYIRRFLMMSVDKTLPIDKLVHFKRDFGLPDDFRNDWIYEFPNFFRVVKKDDNVLYLKLTSWDPALAFTELERKLNENTEELDVHRKGNLSPGLLTVPFPLRWPSHYPRRKIPDTTIQIFQELPYLSPYADPSDLVPGSKEFEKRAVAVLHEILSFTLEKRLIADHLTHFHKEFRLPQKLMRLLLRYFGIFYVSEKGKRFHVFLTTAYKGSELIEKSPLVLWKEKVEKLMGERRRQRVKVAYINMDDDEATNGAELDLGSDYDKEETVYMGKCSGGCVNVKEEDGNLAVDTEDIIEKQTITVDDKMDVQEIIRAYER
ncbi:hypothetical protein SUGI_0485430 [Cryptomeria japonica]|uniref:protein WHAT'S THIS FACTOR 1 homolog, chloroplastic n=1 Tax=Cryptomeria japonica TaxID=3369 RepID=UPI0024089F6F|nr:protein WHAT'S THIS FACTOR 1 homolog, chloroplastic [Cryptomeria japonica]GLJ25348.1 hypothetical protein SUGI_0485430 [Cryptomeria japonica]